MTKPSENEEEKTAKRRVQVARDHDGRMGVAKGMYIYVYIYEEEAVGGAKADAFPGFINPTHS